MNDRNKAERILVIKLGALGDFVQALGPCAAIRRHHGHAQITLMTTKPLVELAQASGYFDEIKAHMRPKWWQLAELWRLRQELRDGRYDRVYDLQTSARSSRYFWLMGPGPRPQWSGVARGCSHPHDNPRRGTMHTIERQAEQLRHAGIADTPLSDLSWAKADLAGFTLPERFALMAAGGTLRRADKRWPVECYGQLARWLLARGITPVALGTLDEQTELAPLFEVRGVVNLLGQTSLLHIATLARQACCAVGNDTGPLHMIALSGCPTLALFGPASDPALCGQRGPRVEHLSCSDLKALSVDDVCAKLEPLMA